MGGGRRLDNALTLVSASCTHEDGDALLLLKGWLTDACLVDRRLLSVGWPDTGTRPLPPKERCGFDGDGTFKPAASSGRHHRSCLGPEP